MRKHVPFFFVRIKTFSLSWRYLFFFSCNLRHSEKCKYSLRLNVFTMINGRYVLPFPIASNCLSGRFEDWTPINFRLHEIEPCRNILEIFTSEGKLSVIYKNITVFTKLSHRFYFFCQIFIIEMFAWLLFTYNVNNIFISPFPLLIW